MKSALLQKNKSRRVLRDRVFAVILTTIVVAMLVTLALVVRQKSTKPTAIGDYEGTIVDRWADYAESEQGSRARLALVIESGDGKRFTVRVDPNVYDSARVGMRIRSRNGQVVLIEPGNKPAGK